MTEEAKLVETEHGLVAGGEGWFVVDVRDAQWGGNETNGRYTSFEGEVPWKRLGAGIHVLEPGQPMAKYHAESNHEAFLVLSGEALLLVEGEERRMKAWDFFHCPAWTEHVLVGAGNGPCAIMCVSTRSQPSDIRYVASELARKHGAAPPHDTSVPQDAYADVERPTPRRYQPGDLPDW